MIGTAGAAVTGSDGADMHTTPRGMGSAEGGVNTSTNTPAADLAPTLSQREQLRIEFYKTYDVMTGVRIAATLGGFFGLMVLLVVYKSRCKSNRQLQDPRLTAAAEAAVAEAEAEERALAAALEALARQQPKPARGPRRSLCVEVIQPRSSSRPGARFASVGGGYDWLLGARPARQPQPAETQQQQQQRRRCSEATCSSSASGYLERCLERVDIRLTRATPEASPGRARRRAPLASMASLAPAADDTDDELSGFSTDSSEGPAARRRPGPAACLSISARVDAPRSPVLSTTTSSSQNSLTPTGPAAAIELRYRAQQQQQQQQQPRPGPAQETLF